MRRFEIIADLFCHHDVEVCFALLGDANMHWAGAMHERGVKFIYTRHEHAAVAAAAAYTRSTGKIGCASVTCGPGLTQIMTILPIAVRANSPIVIFAGEAPLGKPWYNQMIDQAPFVRRVVQNTMLYMIQTPSLSQSMMPSDMRLKVVHQL